MAGRIELIRKCLTWLAYFLALCLVLRAWTVSGYHSVYFDSDLARDLKELSNIQEGKVVWLGPWLGPGLHASSAYYYFFYPALFISGGNIESLITANLLLAGVAVGGFGLFATKKYGFIGTVSMVCLGLTPFVTQHVLHPGNGYSYIFLTILCLTALWFKQPLLVASGTAGLGLALHPATGFLPLFLFVEWWRRGRSLVSAIFSLVIFLIPLAPTIAFEVITKGYITRSWLERPSTSGISWTFGFHNWHQLSGLLGLPYWLFGVGLISLLLLAMTAKGHRPRMWVGLVVTILITILFVDNVLGRYLFGVATGVFFLFLVLSMQRKILIVPLALLAVLLVQNSPLFYPYPTQSRTMQSVQANINQVAAANWLSKNEPLAVVAAVTEATEVPQADDYRYLFRNAGYRVVDVTEASTAANLLMIIEVPNFDWSAWSTWEIDSFGPRQLERVESYKGVTYVIYSRI